MPKIRNIYNAEQVGELVCISPSPANSPPRWDAIIKLDDGTYVRVDILGCKEVPPPTYEYFVDAETPARISFPEPGMRITDGRADEQIERLKMYLAATFGYVDGDAVSVTTELLDSVRRDRDETADLQDQLATANATVIELQSKLDVLAKLKRGKAG